MKKNLIIAGASGWLAFGLGVFAVLEYPEWVRDTMKTYRCKKQVRMLNAMIDEKNKIKFEKR